MFGKGAHARDGSIVVGRGLKRLPESSPLTGSSESKQARFFCELFRALDAHAKRIPRLALLRLNDVTPDEAQALAGPYGSSTPGFVEYLRTLGLRSAADSDKPSFSIAAGEAALKPVSRCNPQQ